MAAAATTASRVATFYEEHCIYLPAMAGWFLFSALLSSYNKVRALRVMLFPFPFPMVCF
jgi:hypothetical protein